MIGREELKEVFATLGANKLRTALTGFAVGWGILILVLLLSSGAGISNGIYRSMSMSGMDNAGVRVAFGWMSVPYNGFPKYYEPKYTTQDIEEVRRHLGDKVRSVSGYHETWGQNASYGGRMAQLPVLGVNEEMPQVRHIQLLTRDSRFINASDVSELRKVVVLAESAAKKLFGTPQGAVGKDVEMDKVIYRVIGVCKNDMGGKGHSYVPLTTAQLMSKRYHINGFFALMPSLKTEEQEKAFREQLVKIFAPLKGFSPQDDTLFWIRSRAQDLEMFDDVSGGIDTFLWIMGLSTLFIGLVGVVNIMQISVAERKKEIGIRKALGAKPRSILGMVLTESVFVTLISGLIGLSAGVGLVALITQIMEATGIGRREIIEGSFTLELLVNPIITPSTALGAVLVMVVGGLLAGYFPARRALRVPTVEAMRG